MKIARPRKNSNVSSPPAVSSGCAGEAEARPGPGPAGFPAGPSGAGCSLRGAETSACVRVRLSLCGRRRRKGHEREDARVSVCNVETEATRTSGDRDLLAEPWAFAQSMNSY